MANDMRRIARAVISQALSDAGLGMERGFRVMVTALDQDEAKSFLLSESGSWRQSREFWCDLAELCPERLRQRSEELLAVPKPSPPNAASKPPSPFSRTQPKAIRRRKLPTPGTKLADVFYLVQRPEGVSADEIMAMLKWTRPTALSAISDLRLFGIVSKRGIDGRYRVMSLP